MDAVDTGCDISLMIQAGKPWVNDAHVAESPRSVPGSLAVICDDSP
jgi:hypothetical protein